MKKLKKNLAFVLIFFMVLNCLRPGFVLAEDGSTDSTSEATILQDPGSAPPSEPTEVEIENQAEVDNEVDSTAITGENTIEEPTPTPTVDPASLEGNLETEVTPTPTPLPAEIETGDAISVVEVENSVNTTEVNSQTIYHTLNIFVPQGSDIDLSTTPLVVADTIFNQNNNLEPVVNVAVFNNQNFAYLSNEIVSLAMTGNNSIEGADEAIIDTGDAYSVVTLLNKVNTTIVDSTIHVVTINIFGGVDGNILLPEFSSESGEGCCGEVIQINNQVSLTNEVDSTAISGQNTITGQGEASIETGEAVSAVNLVNIVNTNLIGVTFYNLYINTFGSWTGDFLGWDDFGALEGGGSLSLNSINANGNSSCSGCYGDISIGNQALVTNKVSSTANTGGNSIQGEGATIKTGNAYSAVSIVNFINSSIIKSLGFFGFINIFGSLNGDIGGASLFATSEPEDEAIAEESSAQGEPGPFIREEGGLIEVELDDNIGTHVLPGDTITFFVKVKNPGTARLYDVHLWLGLAKDGVNMGGGTFNLGDIEAKKGVKVTTGLVLSKEAEPGEYLAFAEARGLVGPGDTEISATDEKPFLIGGFGPWSELPAIVEEAQAVEEEEVLGAAAPTGPNQEEIFKWLALFLPMTYITSVGIRKRKELTILLSSFIA